MEKKQTKLKGRMWLLVLRVREQAVVGKSFQRKATMTHKWGNWYKAYQEVSETSMSVVGEQLCEIERFGWNEFWWELEEKWKWIKMEQEWRNKGEKWVMVIVLLVMRTEQQEGETFHVSVFFCTTTPEWISVMAQSMENIDLTLTLNSEFISYCSVSAPCLQFGLQCRKCC